MLGGDLTPLCLEPGLPGMRNWEKQVQSLENTGVWKERGDGVTTPLGSLKEGQLCKWGAS